MPKQNQSSLRRILLVLILVIGPVQAQALFACEMMDRVPNENCCCDEYSDLGDVVLAKSDPCCEKSIELSVDHSGEQSPPTAKPLEVRSDVDPPQTLFVAAHSNLNIQIIGRTVYPTSANTFSENGSRTYLVTQRLRI